MSLRLPDSGAEVSADGRRHAPSAARNAGPILAVLRRVICAGGAGAGAGLGHRPACCRVRSGAARGLAAERRGGGQFRLDHGLVGRGGAASDPAGRLCAGLGAGGMGCRSGGEPVAPDPRRGGRGPAGRGCAVAGAGRAVLPLRPLPAWTGKATSEGDAAFDASLRAQDARWATRIWAGSWSNWARRAWAFRLCRCRPTT
jgi:hypothetical protein